MTFQVLAGSSCNDEDDNDSNHNGDNDSDYHGDKNSNHNGYSDSHHNSDCDLDHNGDNDSNWFNGYNGSTWTTFDSKTLTGGAATSIAYKPATAGTYFFRAVYSGNNNYGRSQSGNTDEQLTVSKASTNTAISSSSTNNTSTYGQPVTFTATVTPSTATGTVTFKCGSTVIDTAKLKNSGSTSIIAYVLPIGHDIITAVYNGNSNYSGSTSANLIQIIVAKPCITTTWFPSCPRNSQCKWNMDVSGGLGPFKWSVISGSLPNGCSLNTATGDITGKPASSGTYNCICQVQDGMGNTASIHCSFTIR